MTTAHTAMPTVEVPLHTYDEMRRKELAHDDLVNELQAADRIIKSMLATMTTAQKVTVMDNLGVDCLTRHHERRAALAKATGGAQ